MKPWTRFDTRLKRLTEQALQRLSTYTPIHPTATAARDLANSLLSTLVPRLTAAVERAQQESLEAYLATQAARDAEAAVEDLNETLYHKRTAALASLRATDSKRADAAARELRRADAEWAPATFRALGIERTLALFPTILAATARLLPTDDPDLLLAQQALTTLQTAHDTAGTEHAQALEATRALEHTRDALRAEYSAARQLIGAALTLDRRDDLQRIFPSLRPTPRTRTRDADEDPDTEEDEGDEGDDTNPSSPAPPA